ncbi:ABC-three component system middle component 8 [Haliangium ochraceum]
MNPDRSVLALSAVLLARLKKTRIEGYSDMVEYALQRVKHGDTLFAGAVSLLYLLGLVEYRPRTDSFEYVGP